MEQVFREYYQSPIGLMEIQANDKAITAIRFCDDRGPEKVNPVVQECITQLDEYFSGKRKAFQLNLAPQGTEFNRKVWDALCSIPYGETRSYQQIASAVGNIKACRAVGNANRNNPIPILIPCHRVIGKGGTLTGYNGGIWRKEWLLKHEARR
ncbi:MAG TPA: methylated-DNA--[protein]-cysteine S-methyltransferase [Thermoclostridium caenicola]|nr:methylated-DNA--[protein]-cysteine S-methyltransferase [Thermoclostridium caenicola]